MDRYVRIFFRSRKKRNIFKRAIYEKLVLTRTKEMEGPLRGLFSFFRGNDEEREPPRESGRHKTAGQLFMRPSSEQLYVDLLQIDRAYVARLQQMQQSSSNVSSSSSSGVPLLSPVENSQANVLSSPQLSPGLNATIQRHQRLVRSAAASGVTFNPLVTLSPHSSRNPSVVSAGTVSAAIPEGSVLDLEQQGLLQDDDIDSVGERNL